MEATKKQQSTTYGDSIWHRKELRSTLHFKKNEDTENVIFLGARSYVFLHIFLKGGVDKRSKDTAQHMETRFDTEINS